MQINYEINPSDLQPKLDQFWKLSGQKILSIEKTFDPEKGAPVFTVNGKYTSRGWTEWTQGFQYGSALIQFDVTGDSKFLDLGKTNTLQKMATHLTHKGVHDHGFNNLSTYGNLLRLGLIGKFEHEPAEKSLYEMALKISGAVQAMRWTEIKDGGFIYSFNGPHSLFVDTIRSCRILMLSHLLGHHLGSDHDEKINLLERACQHVAATARYSIYYGEGRDHYDVKGRTAHESIFNTNDGHFRCPNAQQGFSGFTTWTRGLGWAICGFAEELELLELMDESDFAFTNFDKEEIIQICLKAAKSTADFYIENTPLDGIPYWDTGAPGLANLEDYLNQNSNPHNDYEPVDSSAAAISAQGLIRIGNYLDGKDPDASRYFQAGLTITDAILEDPYLSKSPHHQGLILHSIYHRPNGWDHVPEGSSIPNGESSMWGDYHARELGLLVSRMAQGEYYRFFDGMIQ